jgi:hypothetical protein
MSMAPVAQSPTARQLGGGSSHQIITVGERSSRTFHSAKSEALEAQKEGTPLVIDNGELLEAQVRLKKGCS